jgi:hypothetical protein
MASFNKLKLGSLVLGSALLAPALISACSSSGSNPQPPVYGNDGGDATVGNEAGTPGDDGGSSPEASSSSDGGTDAPSADDGNASPEASLTDAPSPDASGDAADSEAGPTACTGTLTDGGCWVCPSSSDGSLEFLNQCYGTGVKCVSFDSTRLPGFDAGLPPLN